MRYGEAKKSRRLYACAICARPAVDDAHEHNKGMGGRGAKAPEGHDDSAPLCRECHDADHARSLEWRHTDGILEYKPDAVYAALLHAKGIRCMADCWNVALYEGCELNELPDEPR